MAAEIVLIQREGSVAIVTLNRPEKHNAINAEMAAALVRAMDLLEEDDSVHVVVLTGAGERAFCAGADMDDALPRRENPPAVRVVEAADAIARVRRFKKPVIAAINGLAFGGGALLACVCDIRIASERSRYRFPGAIYGLIVGASALPHIVGVGKAKELVFTGKVVDSQEAAQIGLVNQVTPHDQVLQTALSMAQAIAENSPTALRRSKEIIDMMGIPAEVVAREAELNRQLRHSEEHKRRFRAATERLRTPRS